MVDHDAELGLPLKQFHEVGEMWWFDECIEDQASSNHGIESGSKARLQHPVHIRYILDHRPQAPKPGIGRQPENNVWGLTSLHIDPTDNPGNEVSLRGHGEQKLGFRRCRRRLHHYGPVHTGLPQERRKIGGCEIAIDCTEIRRQPAVIAAVEPPEMLMCVDSSHDL